LVFLLFQSEIGNRKSKILHGVSPAVRTACFRFGPLLQYVASSKPLAHERSASAPYTGKEAAVEEIQLTCSCGTALRTPAENVGATVVCPACGREQTVPAPPATADEGGPQEPAKEQPVPKPSTAGLNRKSKIGNRKSSICPFCHEPIKAAARKCPHCQEYLDPKLAKAARKAPAVSALALASFVIAVISPLCLFIPGALAFMLGVLGMLATAKGRASGRGLAFYGMVLGLVWTCLLVLIILGAITMAQEGKVPGIDLSPKEPLF
jgi:hypothetical protein